MSEFASYAVNRARKYVTTKSKNYVQTKVKQAVRSVERKAAETIKRTAEDIVDRVSAKRRRIMPRKGIILGARRARRGVSMTAKNGRRRKFSRASRKRRSGYNGKSLKTAMRKIALNATQTKRFNESTGLNLNDGDLNHVSLSQFQTNCYKLTYNLTNDPTQEQPFFTGDHFFLKGISIAGQISNQDTSTRLGCRIFVFKDESSGFDYSAMDQLNTPQLMWYNRFTGAGTRYVSLPEPYKHAPKMMKGQTAKMVWSKSYELDYKTENNFSASSGDAATFKKYIPISREMRLKTATQTKPQCQWWLGVTWYKLDMEQGWGIDVEGKRPNMSFLSTTYFKDP